MKRLAAIFLCALTLALAGCSPRNVPAAATPTPTETSALKQVVLSKGDCFEVRMLSGSGSVQYSYTVKSRDGRVLEDAVCAEQPQVKPITNNLLGIRFTGETGSFVRYYDLIMGRVSQSYFGAFWDNGTLVACNHFAADGELVVTNIFDNRAYSYTEKIESDAMKLIVVSAEQSEDKKTLRVTYTLGEHGAEQTVDLKLEKTPSD